MNSAINIKTQNEELAWGNDVQSYYVCPICGGNVTKRVLPNGRKIFAHTVKSCGVCELNTDWTFKMLDIFPKQFQLIKHKIDIFKFRQHINVYNRLSIQFMNREDSSLKWLDVNNSLLDTSTKSVLVLDATGMEFKVNELIGSTAINLSPYVPKIPSSIFGLTNTSVFISTESLFYKVSGYSNKTNDLFIDGIFNIFEFKDYCGLLYKEYPTKLMLAKSLTTVSATDRDRLESLYISYRRYNIAKRLLQRTTIKEYHKEKSSENRKRLYRLMNTNYEEYKRESSKLQEELSSYIRYLSTIDKVDIKRIKEEIKHYEGLLSIEKSILGEAI